MVKERDAHITSTKSGIWQIVKTEIEASSSLQHKNTHTHTHSTNAEVNSIKKQKLARFVHNGLAEMKLDQSTDNGSTNLVCS